MTKREFYEAIAKSDNKEYAEFAQSRLAEMGKQTDARKAKEAEKRDKENAPIIAAIVGYLQNGKIVAASEIASSVGVSTQKASSLLTKMANDGTVFVEKIKGASGRKVNGYGIVAK